MMGPRGALTTTYSYDSRGRTTQILHALSGSAQQTTGYGYDSVGNVLSYSDAIAGGTTFSTGYGYDYANRLLSENRTGGTASQDFSNSYAYDKDGNRTSTTRNGVASAYTIGLNDQFLSGDGCGASNYDADGNPGLLTTCTKSYSFAYDFKDQPSSLTINPTAGAATSIAYVVDGDSHRVGKSVAGQTTKYIYDGDTVVAEIDPLGNITYELPDIGYVTSGVQNYYQENGLGSTLSVRSNAGALQSQSEYDAYGIYYQLVAGPQSDFRFAGGHNYVTDSETGLLELGHRYYIPILGRFLNQDPIGDNPTATQSAGNDSSQGSNTQEGDLKAYEYCRDNPLGATDSNGESPENTGNVFKQWWDGGGGLELDLEILDNCPFTKGVVSGVIDGAKAAEDDMKSLGTFQQLSQEGSDLRNLKNQLTNINDNMTVDTDQKYDKIWVFVNNPVDEESNDYYHGVFDYAMDSFKDEFTNPFGGYEFGE